MRMGYVFVAGIVVALLFATACLKGAYHDTYTPGGLNNFHTFAPRMYRTGYPTTPAAWNDLRQLVEGQNPGVPVTRVVLHDEAEGSEETATSFGWNVVWIPLFPEDDKPITVVLKPSREAVERAVQTILDAHARGEVVVWGCVHGRDRTGLVSALVGMRMFGWTKDQAWKYAVDTGLRVELPGLDLYWAQDVPG